MKGPQGYALIINVAMNIILGVLITVCFVLHASMAMIGVQFVTPALVAGTVISSFCVGFTAGTLVPAMPWGMKLAGLLKVKPGGLGMHVCCSVMLGLCMGVCITIGNFLIADLGTSGLAGALSDIAVGLPIIVAYAIVFVLIFLKPVQRLRRRFRVSIRRKRLAHLRATLQTSL